MARDQARVISAKEPAARRGARTPSRFALMDRVSFLISGRRPWASHALVLPAALWLCFFLILPVILVLAISFTRRGPYGVLLWSWTWQNYGRALVPVYLPVLLRSVSYSGLATALCLALGFPAAYALSFFIKGRKGLWVLLLMLPFWTSCLVAIYSWMIFLGREGLINNLLLWTGAISSPIQFLNTPFSVILGLTYFYLPFMVLPLYSSLEKIPKAYLEASGDLGAGPWATFVRVILPLSLPGIGIGCLLTFIPCLGDFLTAEFLGGTNTYLIGNLIENQFLSAQDWPFGSALTAILGALMLAGLGTYLRLEPSATEQGGLK